MYASTQPNAHVNPPALRERSADRKALAFRRSVLNVLLGLFKFGTLAEIAWRAKRSQICENVLTAA